MKQSGDNEVDLLKMDIEGAEYAVIRNIINDDVLPRLLLIEFDEVHSPLDTHSSERIKQHVDLLVAAGMKCVAVEGSNATFARSQLS